MGKGVQGAVLRALGAQDHFITVTGKTVCNEHYVRVNFHSDTLLNGRQMYPGAWVRMWFPNPDNATTLHQRGYTIVDADPQTGNFSVEFVLHHPMGPASYWASRAQVGDELVAMWYGTQPFKLLDPAPEGYLLLGDTASYPAISAICATIPQDIPVVVYLEQHNDYDTELPLPEGENITAAWVQELPDGQALAQAIDGEEFTGWYGWVCAESTTTRRAKSLLQRKYGLNRATLHSQAYWMRGRAMGKSRTLEELNASFDRDVSSAARENTAARQEEKTAGSQGQPRQDTAGTDPGKTETTPSPAGAKVAAAAVTEPPQDTEKASAPHRAAKDKPVRVLEPAKKVLWVARIIQLFLSIIQVIPFILFAEIARLFMVGAADTQFSTTVILALAIMGVSATGTTVLLFALHLYDARFSAALRAKLMDKLSTLPLGWFSSRSPGEVKKLVADDVTSLHYVVTHADVDCVGAIATPLIVLVYLFGVQWRLGLVLLIPLVIYIAVMVRIMRRDRENTVTSQRYTALASAQAQTFITSREQGRIFGASSVVDLPATLKETGDFIAQWQQRTGPAKINAVILNRPTTILGLLTFASYLLLIPGWITVPELLPFFVLGTSFGGQLLAISTNIGALYTALEARDALETFLGTPSLEEQHANTHAAPEQAGSTITLENVTFGYRPGQPVLQNFSFQIPAQQVTALVGPSGSGKSTVAALAARLWDPQTGRVLINGVDARSLTQNELYSQVSILLQDVQLIRGTVRENIALTNPEATDEQIHAAAKAAHLHEVITALPQGYETVVDNDRLSGGQRQRVGITRALLANTPIVILDEATASADADSEWEIHRGLDKLLAGRTVLIIAHRLHTITGADRIAVLDSGSIIEAGTHRELVDSGGLYASLWQQSTEPAAVEKKG